MKTLLFIIFGLLVSFKSLADSPLTSTDFGKAYLDFPIVQEAFKSNGKITNEMVEFICEKDNPLDVKLALINGLGWEKKGMMNSKVFFMYVMKKKNYQSEFTNNDYIAFKWYATPDELICFAYMQAMDNYFDVTEAFEIASEALRKAPYSFAVNMIYNLLKSQGLFSFGESCYASKLFMTLKDPTLTMDMKKEAIGYIFSYIISINDNCNKI